MNALSSSRCTEFERRQNRARRERKRLRIRNSFIRQNSDLTFPIRIDLNLSVFVHTLCAVAYATLKKIALTAAKRERTVLAQGSKGSPNNNEYLLRPFDNGARS